MKKIGSPKLLFENLDLTPIHSILWTDLHIDGPGRPVEYNPEWDLKALMLRQLEQIPYVKDLVKRLRRNSYLRRACGYGDRAPCEAHFSQMKKRIGAEGFRIIEAWLRREAMRLRRSQPLSATGLARARFPPLDPPPMRARSYTMPKCRCGAKMVRALTKEGTFFFCSRLKVEVKSGTFPPVGYIYCEWDKDSQEP